MRLLRSNGESLRYKMFMNTDVMLLANEFESFRNKAMEKFK